MKIIKQGEIKPPAPPWWVGRQLTCTRDDTAIELEAGDQRKVIESAERHPDGKRTIYVTCPTCGFGIQHISCPPFRI